jgi:polyisoprenoid-binding protein YceI
MFMRSICIATLALTSLLLPSAGGRAEDFKFDNVHSSVTFKIEHAGVGYVHGRFNENAGEFTFDKSNLAKAKFVVKINVATIDTNVKARDDHLRTADFFDVKKFPEAVFTSTSVKSVNDGWQVTGDFSLHGVTKPVSFILKGGKTTENKGQTRIGFWTEFSLRRTEFGMSNMVGLVGDEVFVAISFEGVTAKK